VCCLARIGNVFIRRVLSYNNKVYITLVYPIFIDGQKIKYIQQDSNTDIQFTFIGQT